MTMSEASTLQESNEIIFPDILKKPVHPYDTIDIASKKIIINLFEEIISREEGTKKGVDIEDLHRMRVSIRRLRAYLRAVKPLFGKNAINPILKELKRIARLLGEVRDIDTFVEFLKESESTLPESMYPAIKLLIETRLKERQVGLQKIRDEFDSPAYQNWKQSFFKQIMGDTFQCHHPPIVRDIAPQLILTAYDVVLGYRGRVEDAPATLLHELRIKNKRFRYLCELFQTCYDDRMEAVRKDCKKLQDILGDIQDKNRDIHLIESNYEAFSESVSNQQGNHPLKEFLEHLKTLEQAGRRKFHTFWHSYSLPENEQRIRYLVQRAFV